MKIPMKTANICRRILEGLIVSALLVSCDSAADPNSNKAKTLVWSDEFEGNSVDLSKWTFEIGNGGANPGWGNNELQYYRSENSTMKTIAGESSRALVITAKQESFGGQSYTSSRLKTQDKASWTYGRIEARMKLPEGQGIWPAFWMLGNAIGTVGWPQCGEIDIMEMVGGAGLKNKTTYGTAHWEDGGHQYRGGNLVFPSNLSAGFHVFAVEWTSRALTWSVDGTAFFTQPITSAALAELQKPAFLLLNLAVGGQWPGNPDGSTVFPQEFWIDWIRVYQ